MIILLYNNYLDKRSEGKGFPVIKEFKEGELLNVDVTGCDCLLIPRNIFKQIKFEFKPEVPLAEDFGFCLQAREKGYRILVDTSVTSKHITFNDIKIGECKCGR